MASDVSMLPMSKPNDEAKEPIVPPRLELLFISGARLRLEVYVRGIHNIKVASADGEIKCNYYDYLTKYQDAPFWSKGVNSIKKLFAEKETQIKGVSKSSPYMLSKRQDGKLEDLALGL